jgi:aspartyl-tRNA(Asn)/glutamyl-tRNA(Gln) amidotransferase subunit C
MELSPEELERVAGIARVPLEGDDVDRFEEELESILDDFAVLDEAYGDADGDGAEVAGSGRLRPDEVREPDPDQAAAIRAAFPRSEADLLRVPGGLR